MKIAKAINKVPTINKDLKLIKIAKIFSKEKINNLVLIKDKKAVGIITERDIIKNIEKIHKKKMSEVMAKKIITISYDKELEDAAELMKNRKIKRLLVTDENNELVGIITASDIIKNAKELNKRISFFD